METAVLMGTAKLSVADNRTSTNTFMLPGICRLLNIGALKNKPDNRPSNNKNPSIGNGITYPTTLPGHKLRYRCIKTGGKTSDHI